MNERWKQVSVGALLVGLLTVVPSVADAADGGDPGSVEVHPTAETGSADVEELRASLEGATVEVLAAEAAAIQTRFVDATLNYDRAKVTAAAARDTAADLAARADRIDVETQGARRALSAQVVQSIQNSGNLSSNPLIIAVQGSDSLRTFIETQSRTKFVVDFQQGRIDGLQREVDAAALIRQEAVAAATAAAEAEAQAEARLKQINEEAKIIADAATEALVDADAIAAAEQEARNRAAKEQWRGYLHTLRAAHIDLPLASAMDSDEALPPGLQPVLKPGHDANQHGRGDDGGGRESIEGVASINVGGQTVIVLPSETVDMVTAAFESVDAPYQVDAKGPDAFDCGGFVSYLWSLEDYDLPGNPSAQLGRVRKVPAKQAQVGDLVFPQSQDVTNHVGIYLGGELMLAADGSIGEVGVVPVVGEFTAARVTLPRDNPPNKPVPEGHPTSECGVVTSVATTGGFTSPVEEGLFRFTSTFGETGELWSSGTHTGLDFAAPSGTEVRAATSGTIHLDPSQEPWAGPHYMALDSGDGIETTYAHMERADVGEGDRVEAGQVIGSVGAYGNVTGPHLHFEVHINGIATDPMPFLGGGGATAAGWGGFSNGMIPASVLCTTAFAPVHTLRCDAARALDQVAAAFQAKFGAPMCITDSYRSYSAQVGLYARKPGLAAVPGTSNHGWALAVDLCGGINSFGTPEHEWMQTNAPRFGWVSPAWSHADGSKPEPWHWEFGAIS